MDRLSEENIQAHLIDFLSSLPNANEPNYRQSFVRLTGIHGLERQINWEGNTLIFFGNLVSLLTHTGSVTLSGFLTALAKSSLVPLEKQEPLSLLSQIIASFSPKQWEKAFISGKHLYADNTSIKVPSISPPPEIPNFTGRSKELEKLQQLLLIPDGSHQIRLAGLVGTGGMGKSTLAGYFASVYQTYFPDGVISLRVSHKTAEALREELAHQLKIDPPQNKFEAMKFMETHFSQRQSLLIFDNVENASIKELLPGGEQCAIIITMRNGNLCKSFNIAPGARIDLKGFTFPETKEFFIRLLGEQSITNELESVQKIHDMVGGHPLALRIIGSGLQYDGDTFKKCATELEQEKQHLPSFFTNPDDPDLCLHACFSLSLVSLTAEERVLFACLGACTPEGFTLGTAQAVSNVSPALATKGMTRLCQLSLVNKDTTRDRYMLHPLLFAFVQEQATEQGLLKIAEQRHTAHFVAYAEQHKALYPADFTALEEEFGALLLTGMRQINNIQHVKDMQDAINFYMIVKPIAINNRGYALQANDWLNMLIEIAKKQNILFYEIFCLLQRESISQEFAWYEEAEQLLVEAERLIAGIEEETQRTALTAMLRAKQGSISRSRENLKEAEKFFQEALLLWSGLGRAWERGKILNKLGALYALLDKQREAETALIESLEIYEQLKDMKCQAKVLNTLGGLYQKLGKTQEAEQKFLAALDIAEQLGDRRSIGMLHRRLGGLYRIQGKKKEAKEALEKALVIATEVGDIRGDIAAVRSLKDILLSENKVQEVRNLLQTHLELMRKVAYTGGIAQLLNMIGDLYLSQNQLTAAEEVLQESIKFARESSIPSVIAEVLQTLGKMYHIQKNQQKSLDVLRENIQFIQFSLEQGNTSGITPILRSLGIFYQKQRWFDLASICFQKLFEIQEVQHSPLIGKTTSILVNNLLLSHNKNQARQYMERALAIVPNDPSLSKVQNRVFQKNNEEILRERINTEGDTLQKAMTLHKLGTILQTNKEFEQAKEIFLESLNIGRKIKHNRHIGLALKSLGEIYALQGNMPDAEQALEESYTLAAEVNDKQIIAVVQETRGKILLEHGQFERSATCLQESFALYQELQSIQGAELLYFLGKVLIILDKIEEAQAYCQRARACWPGHSGMEGTLRYLQRKISTHVSIRKVGYIKRLIPANLHRAPYGFIVLDDGSEDIYFKQEVVEGELVGYLQSGMRVWADIEIVKGRPRAIKIGRETARKIDEFEGPTPGVSGEADVPVAEGKVQTLKVEARVDVSNDLTLLKVLQGEKREDETTLRNLLEISETEEEKAQILYRLGKLYQMDNRLTQATEAYSESGAIGRELKLTRHTGIVLKSLADIYTLQGKVQNAEEALEESYTLAAEESDLLGMAEIQRSRGKLLLDRGEIERACIYFQKSFALYEEIPNKLGIEEIPNKLGIKVLYFLVRVLIILKNFEEAQAYWQHARTLWPEDDEMVEIQNQLEREFSFSLQHPIRKVGRIKRLIPAGLENPAIGFIAPDDGSQDIYFKQEILASDLRILLRTNMRVWADVQVVRGKPQAIRVGKEVGSSANTSNSQKALKEEVEKTLRDRLETFEIGSDTQDEEALEVSYTPTFERGERVDFDLITEALVSLTAESSSLDVLEHLCPKCGELLPSSARFCGACGTKLHLLIDNPGSLD